MVNYNNAVENARALLKESEAYAEKPTKAGSARLRKLLNEGKKLVTASKNELLEADKAGK